MLLNKTSRRFPLRSLWKGRWIVDSSHCPNMAMKYPMSYLHKPDRVLFLTIFPFELGDFVCHVSLNGYRVYPVVQNKPTYFSEWGSYQPSGITLTYKVGQFPITPRFSTSGFWYVLVNKPKGCRFSGQFPTIIHKSHISIILQFYI